MNLIMELTLKVNKTKADGGKLRKVYQNKTKKVMMKKMNILKTVNFEQTL